MNNYLRRGLSVLVLLLTYWSGYAQTDTLCNPNENKKIFGEAYLTYGGVANAFSSFNRSDFTVGQAVVTVTTMLSQTFQAGFGQWSPWLLPPQPPALLASQGDFKDRIKLSWQVNPLSPAPTGFVIYRDGSFLADLGENVAEFLDFNVQAGEYYEYSIEAKNTFGTGSKNKYVGFVNPNGVVSGKIETNSGNPVPGVEVRLTPLTGSAMSFDGIDDQLCISYNTKFPTSSFTVSAYVKLGVGNNEAGIIDWGSTINSNWWITTTKSSEGKGYIFHIGNGTGSDSLKYILPVNEVTMPGNADKWHQITMIYNGSALSVLVDGNFVGTKPATILRTKQRLNIGSKSTGSFYKGLLDDVRIYNRPLTQTEINTTKNRSISKTENGLVAYWKMDEGLGEKVFDNSNIPTNAAVYGGVKFSNDIPEVYNAGVSDVTGYYIIDGINYSQVESFRASPIKNFEFNTALEFNAADKSYGDLTNYDIPDTSTVEVLFHPFDLKSRQTVLSKGSLYELYVDNGKLFLNLNGTLTDLGTIKAKYYHVAATINNTTGAAKIYLEGELKASVSFTGVSNWAGGNPWLAATNATAPTGKFYTGLIDEVAIYKTALSQQDIQLHFVTGIPQDSTTANLFSYFDFNEGTDAKVYDYGTLNFGGALPREGTITKSTWSKNVRRSQSKAHEFEPNVRIVNLNTSNTAVGNIDFRDVSTVNVSGTVRFSNTFCFSDSVKIQVNGQDNFPPIITNKKGQWSVDFEPGRTVKLTAKYNNHLFSPGFVEFRKLQAPKAGVVFLDNTKRVIRGQVAGGDCKKSIIAPGARVVVKVATLDGCFEKTDTLRTPDGKFVFTDLPARAFRVSIVEHSNSVIYNYFQLKGGQETDLRDVAGDTIDFIYYAKPQIEASAITGSIGCTPDALVLNHSKYSTTFKVFEEYDGGRCYLESATIVIKNEISNAPDSTVQLVKGSFKYDFIPGNPNITPPYTKKIEASTTVGGRPGILEIPITAIVTGEKSAGGQTFTSISEPIIIDVLRDPPGDQSYAWREKGTTSCGSFSIAVDRTAGESLGLFASVGPNFEISSGSGFFNVEVEQDIVIEGSQTWNHSRYYNQNITNQVCFTSTEVISTSASEDFVGKDGDVYIGTTLNIKWGINDVLDWNKDSCKVTLSKKLTADPTTFNSRFVYSRLYVENTVIPELKQLELQTVDAKQKKKYRDAYTKWATIFEKEDQAKSLAQVYNDEIVTIDAGATIQRTLTSEKSVDKSITYREEFSFDSENTAGYFQGGVGLQGTLAFNLNTTTEGVRNENSTETTSYGFFIGDDDRGDGFAVAISSTKADAGKTKTIDPEALRKKISDLDDDFDSKTATPDYDKLNFDRLLKEGSITNAVIADWSKSNVYPSPIFSLLAATSSCPYEGGRRRDKVAFTSDVSQLINVPSNTSAVFKLRLGNESPSFESRTYALKLVNESNPNGAIVKVNGQPITSTPVTFAVKSRELQEVILTIDRGPVAFNYEDIKIAYYSECEYDQREALDEELDPEVYQTLSLDVNFIEPCSPVDIGFPLQDWVVTPGSDNKLSITLNEYEKADADLKLIRLQYRPIGGDGSWINISETQKAALGDVFTIKEWNTSLLKDGPYEIRAVAKCTNLNLAPGISTVVKGKLERLPPELVGTPQPSDGTWDPGDEISITFNEDIDCDKLFKADALGNNTIGLYDATTNALVDATFSCVGNKIIIVPNINPIFFENRAFRVTVSGKEYDDAKIAQNANHQRAALRDKAGNMIPTSISWEFAVNQNNLEWVGTDVIETNTVLNPFSVKRQIRNRGGTIVNFRMESIPSWLTISPATGALNPGQVADITLTFQQDMLIGDYKDTLQLVGSKGSEPLLIDYRVRCAAPNYVIDNPSQYEGTMNMVVDLSIFGVVSTDPSDIIVAKINGQIRGIGRVAYYRNINKWLTFMTIYGNSADIDKKIEFHVWDGDKCNEYVEILEEVTYQEGGLVGSPIEPASIHVLNLVNKCIPLNKGWNWVSFNLNLGTGNNTVAKVLATLKHKTGASIKDDTKFSEYIGYWDGTLETLSPTKRYLLYVAEKDTICIKGAPYKSSDFPINIVKNWNWLGYVPSTGMTVTQALKGLRPLNGDLIKSQTLFAQYVAGIGWVGNLSFLEPLKGYMLKISTPGTLTYSESGSASLSSAELSTQESGPVAYDFAQYQSTMNIIGKVEGMQIDPDDELRAYIDTKLVGVNKSILYKKERLFFQTVYNQDNNNVTFTLYKADRKKEFVLNRLIQFKAETLAGLTDAPIIFNLTSTASVPVTVTIADQVISQPTKIFQNVDIRSKIVETNANCTLFAINTILPSDNISTPTCPLETGLEGNMSAVIKVNYSELSTFVAPGDVLSFINPATNTVVGCAEFKESNKLFYATIGGGTTSAEVPIDAKYYSSAMKKTFTLKSAILYKNNTRSGNALTPVNLDFSPLTVSSDANGVITAVMRDTSWTGKYCVDAFAMNCAGYSDGQASFCFQRLKQGDCVELIVRKITESQNTVVQALSISSEVIINAGIKIEYKGGNSIELKPGFETKSGTTFTGQIEGCNNAKK